MSTKIFNATIRHTFRLGHYIGGGGWGCRGYVIRNSTQMPRTEADVSTIIVLVVM